MKIELAIKFGSNEIIVYRKGRGIIARSSTYVATLKSNGKICAYGDEAKHLYDIKASKYDLCQPVRGVDIVEPKLAVALLRHVINKGLTDNGLIWALVAVPCALPERNLLEIEMLLQNSGVFKVIFVQNAVCVRANLTNMSDDAKVMVVDIGKYVTDISVSTKYEFLMGRNYLIGGIEMDCALQTYIEDNYSVYVDNEQTQSIKEEIASVYENDMYTVTFEAINFQDEYQQVTMRANEARVAIIGVYNKIFDLIEESMESLPNQVLAEVKRNGIVFTGGVASIEGLVEYASKRLNIPSIVVENPKDAVILGAGKLLSLNKDEYPYIKL